VNWPIVGRGTATNVRPIVPMGLRSNRRRAAFTVIDLSLMASGISLFMPANRSRRREQLVHRLKSMRSLPAASERSNAPETAKPKCHVRKWLTAAVANQGKVHLASF
jgi:hypothetical protein